VFKSNSSKSCYYHGRNTYELFTLYCSWFGEAMDQMDVFLEFVKFKSENNTFY
jgi:hypothetical protein